MFRKTWAPPHLSDLTSVSGTFSLLAKCSLYARTNLVPTTRPTTGSGARSTPLWVHSKSLLATVKRLELAWFGNVTSHNSLSRNQRKWWVDNIREWTSRSMAEPLTRASCRKDWKRISAESSLMSRPLSPHPRTTESVKGLLNGT